jgi:hypothetical protein
MKPDFIRINDIRLRVSSIKKYCPSGDTKLNIYYNTSRYKVEVETFTFTTEHRNEVLEQLDNLLYVQKTLKRVRYGDLI